MTSGGHARSGPARDPNALRRGDAGTAGWTRLINPTEPPPEWPLGDEPSEREVAIWTDLWARPQASVWPRLHLTREVAAYTRTLAIYEAAPQAAMGTLLRRLADDLGLTIPGAARNRWLLPGADEPEAVTPRPIGGASRRGARERFRVIPADPIPN